MKLLRQLCIILVIYYAGEFIHKLLNIPIPGSVIGMIILFLCLYTKIIKLEMIEDISKFLLDHLSFFFLPAGVGLIASMDVFRANWLAILGICFIVTIIVMVVTGHTVQFLKRRQKK